jgi:hypothetical protein
LCACDERRVGLCAHGLGRLFVHPDQLGRLDELEAAVSSPGRAEEDRRDLSGGSSERARDDLVRCAVAPHRVDRDSGQGQEPLRGRRAERFDLAALVRLAGRADVVRPLGLMAGRADVDARRLDAVLRAPLVSTGLRRFFSWGLP